MALLQGQANAQICGSIHACNAREISSLGIIIDAISSTSASNSNAHSCDYPCMHTHVYMYTHIYIYDMHIHDKYMYAYIYFLVLRTCPHQSLIQRHLIKEHVFEWHFFRSFPLVVQMFIVRTHNPYNHSTRPQVSKYSSFEKPSCSKLSGK